MSSDSNRDGYLSGEEIIVMLRKIGGDQPDGDRPRGSRPSADRPSADRPSGDRPSADGPSGDRPSADGPSADGPSGDRPSGRRPSGRRPESAQGDMPRRGGFGGPPRDGDPRQFFVEMFRMRDQNQDGVLKGDEIPEPLAARLEQVDRDGDGAVSRQEMEGMVSRLRDGGGRPGARDAGDGGRRPGGDLPRRPAAEEKSEIESEE